MFYFIRCFPFDKGVACINASKDRTIEEGCDKTYVSNRRVFQNYKSFITNASVLR